MRNDHHCHILILGQIFHNLQNFAHKDGVQGSGWFIPQHHFRFQGQGPGNTYPLLLPAAHFTRALPGMFLHADCGQRFGGPGEGVPFVHTAGYQTQHYIFQSR